MPFTPLHPSVSPSNLVDFDCGLMHETMTMARQSSRSATRTARMEGVVSNFEAEIRRRRNKSGAGVVQLIPESVQLACPHFAKHALSLDVSMGRLAVEAVLRELVSGFCRHQYREFFEIGCG